MKKSAFVAIIGAPNAGKSTLVNLLTGTKVSIVSPKVQTTRIRIIGIITEDQVQLVLVDTPGIFKPKNQLDKAMVRSAWGGLKDTDFALLLVDAKKGLCNDTETIMKGLKERGGRNILLLNKIDLVAKHKLLELAATLNKGSLFEETFMISALSGSGIDDLKKYLLEKAPEGQWMYPEDQVSDLPARMFAAEITREKLMLALDHELPYQLMVETETFEEKADSIKINQVIYVTNESHKKIVIGNKGQSLRNIGEKSRKDLSRLLDKKVHLFLFVKVRENWVREMGKGDW